MQGTAGPCVKPACGTSQHRWESKFFLLQVYLVLRLGRDGLQIWGGLCGVGDARTRVLEAGVLSGRGFTRNPPREGLTGDVTVAACHADAFHWYTLQLVPGRDPWPVLSLSILWAL